MHEGAHRIPGFLFAAAHRGRRYPPVRVMDTTGKIVKLQRNIADPQRRNTAMLPATQTLYFDDLSLGQSETYSKEVKSSDVIGFAEISGDRNPIHLSEHFAARTPFKGRIAHGLYTASLISAVIGTRLPGPGAIYMQQTLNFKAPVRIGDTVVARVEVVELTERGHRARLHCTCEVNGTLVLEGEALVKVPSRAEAEVIG